MCSLGVPILEYLNSRGKANEFACHYIILQTPYLVLLRYLVRVQQYDCIARATSHGSYRDPHVPPKYIPGYP